MQHRWLHAMMNLKLHLFILILLTVLSACSNSLALQSSSPCYFPDVPDIRAPDWVCQQQNTSELLTAVGFAQSSAAGVAFTKKMAMARARVKLAQSLKARCSVSDVKDVMLMNSQLLNTQLSPKEGLYVQIGIRPADLRLVCE